MSTLGIVNLNLNIERVYALPRFVPGGVYRAADATVQAGGKGMNVAAVLRTLGCGAAIAGVIGGVSGESIRRDMARRGLSGSFYRVRGESRTCLVINDTARGVQTVINESGHGVTRREIGELKRFVKGFLTGKSVAVFSGSVLPGITPDDYAVMVRTAVRNGIPAIVDIGGPHLLKAIDELPTVIKPNRTEWENAIGRKLPTTAALVRTVRPVLEKGVCWAVISLGPDGALYFKGDYLWKVKVPKIKAVNAVGCGDAMAAGMAKGLAGGWDDERIVRFSSAVAVAHALTPLPGMVRKADIERILPEIKIVKEKEGRWTR